MEKAEDKSNLAEIPAGAAGELPRLNVVVPVKQTAAARALGLDLPAHTRPGDAGVDLRAAEAVVIAPGRRGLVGTGIHVAIPEGFAGFIKDRSGLAAKSGIHTLAGVVDSNYRGEVKVVLLNTGDSEFRVEINDRIAQMVVLPVAEVTLELREELEESDRGEHGWGSTGVK